nr:ATP-binding cassette domain-containing protein [Micromonospora sp. DSM 115978]
LRALGFAVVGVCVTLFGGFLGGVLLGDLSDRHGPRAAMLAMVGPVALVAAALTAYGARFVRVDLARVVEEITEERDEMTRLATGGEAPVLQVRNLDVSYGSMRVLFGVDLDVWPGEVLALLGTNGAGKSTLLRAVTGLEVPDRGVVRLDGRTVTLDAPQRRVRDGVVLVRGGQGVFGSLTVAENLLAGAHTIVPDRALLE